MVVAAAGLGLALGVVTGMPLGVINVAIVDAATDDRVRYARGLGIGGGLADTAHASLAFFGIGALILARPALEKSLAITAAVIVIAFAVLAWRRRREAPRSRSTERSAKLGAGVAMGIALTLPNPGALGAWVSVAALFPMGRWEAMSAGVGVGIGSVAWFVTLASLVARVRRDHPALRYIPIVATVLLVGLALTAVIRSLLA